MTPPLPPHTPRPLRAGRIRRLRSSDAFSHVFTARLRKSSGPLSVAICPVEDRPFSRLGISVGKRFHKRANHRNRAKRLLREAFRLSQHEHPTLHDSGYDLVAILHPHDPPLHLNDYQHHLLTAWQAAHQVALKRDLKIRNGKSEI